jgi:two-component system NtrC family sensor kinase
MQQPDLDEADKNQFAERSLTELARVNTLIRQLLDHAGSAPQEMCIVEVDQIFQEVCQIVTLKKHNPPISLVRDIPLDIVIECDVEKLRQVFLNCLLNALDAIESKAGEFERQIMITAEKEVVVENQQTNVHIRMKDNGIGIKEKDFEVIFDPFFTTKDPGKGTGLGLFVSHSIIDAHGGRMWINSAFGKGSTVYIDLPICAVEDQKERDETSDHR